MASITKSEKLAAIEAKVYVMLLAELSDYSVFSSHRIPIP